MAISVGELFIISLFLITALGCLVTYVCCNKALKEFDTTGSKSKAINKLRIYDQYILSKINLIISLFYFGISYVFFNKIISTPYIFFISCLSSFAFSLITTFLSRVCYCYTCNLLMDTRINEFGCFMINLKRLLMVYAPFIVTSLVVPTIYLLNIKTVYCNILCIVSLLVIVFIWVIITPKVMVLSYGAKQMSSTNVLNYRIDQLLKMHDIKKYKIYFWDTSKSRESNAMVSGLFTYYLFISSTLIEEITLPELETVITHEIGHIKNKHNLKLMIGRVFIILLITMMFLLPNFIKFTALSKTVFYGLVIIFACLSILIGIGVERKYENEADEYVSCYNDPELFASALKKITKYEEESEGIDELFQDHPSVEQRIRNVNKKKN